MNTITVKLKMRSGFRFLNLSGIKMRFSPYRLFTYDDSPEELRCLDLIAKRLSASGRVAIYGNDRLLEYLLKHAPSVKKVISCIIDDAEGAKKAHGIPVVKPVALPKEVETVFLCETLTVRRWRMKKALPPGVTVLDPDILTETDHEKLPQRAWIPAYNSIYPIDLPEISVEPELDMLLIDSPSRNMAFMPNGLGYVHNALKKTGITFQTVDLDIIVYHRYHIHRILDGPDGIYTPSGDLLPEDPWLAENYELWQKQSSIEYFRPEIDETIAAIVKAKPRIVGFSIQACNIKFATEVAQGVRARLPEIIIIAGGYSCYQPTIGRLAFPESDYMVMGEADLNIGELVTRILAGEKPVDIKGVISRYDPPKKPFVEGPMASKLDTLEMPKYEWYGLDIYRNYNNYQLTPIIASRGCRWSMCKFCAERFFWRVRSPKNVVDEFEYLASQGCDLFMFNESDLNGLPETLLAICDEIIRRKLTIKLTGQLRIHKNSDLAFFEKLKAAGFVSLRFGVDGWSSNTLQLQAKGYTVETISDNLKACKKAGIYNEVNIVLGVPGETDDDITESIALIKANKNYIDRVANINPLMLMSGSVYWQDPGEYNIKFRGDKREILKKHQHIVPDDMWFSEKPYIDEKVRQERFKRVVMDLHKTGFDVGPFAKQVIDDVLAGKGAGRSARPDAGLDTENAEPVTGKTMETWSETPSIENKFRVVRHNSLFYGIDAGKFPRVEKISLPESRITKLVRENPSDIRLITEGFHEYNIIKTEGVFYAIKQGHDFDINLAESSGYKNGVCFSGRRINDVEGMISSYKNL